MHAFSHSMVAGSEEDSCLLNFGMEELTTRYFTANTCDMCTGLIEFNHELIKV